MSPRTPKQFQEMREEKIALIMDVALEHFANNGYYRTTIDQITRRAGISKGLMYNYFESKEALLKAIIHKSVNEVYGYMDLNQDGLLSEEEFEFFLRKLSTLLKEKKHFWRLWMQLFLQNDVREQFLNAFPESDSLMHPGHEPGNNYYPSQIRQMFTDYFLAKGSKKVKTYDPSGDVDIFSISVLGYAIQAIYSENDDNESQEKLINRIIHFFK